MAPPPVPWFRGRSIVLAPSVVSPTQVSGDAISIRAIGRHTFTSPSATTELTLPTEMLVLAIAEGPALGFRGIFTGADSTSSLPIDVVLAPVDPDDALQAERVLNEQLSLPRIPRRLSMSDLSRCEDGEFVRVEGTYRRGKLDDVRLDAADLDEGRRYRVFGFYRRGQLVAVETTLL